MNEKVLAKMIESVNKHMPAAMKNLEEMLKEKDPVILAKDGNEYYIEKKELEFIAQYVDELDRRRFRIPIILEMCEIGGERVVFVRDKLHIEFVKKAFGYDRIVNDSLMLYLYELPAIRRKLRTASQVMFRVEL
ncbi:MAG: DUF61 family protein [Candidatus Methanoglobus sp.]|jgi:uncharacterized protein (UPF0216 family)|nr:MAG: hypothetical protein DSN99_08410 [Archaeoglobi archaeon]TDA26205.1 MAG: hypothetical protein DSO00_07780 [Archaeoglobi archaeon]